MTYRSRYAVTPMAVPVLDLLILDESNPRSLAYQLVALEAHLAALPHDGPYRSPSLRRVLGPLDRGAGSPIRTGSPRIGEAAARGWRRSSPGRGPIYADLGPDRAAPISSSPRHRPARFAMRRDETAEAIDH